MPDQPPPGVDTWVDALQRVSLTDAARAWLRAHLASPECCATEAELEAATGGSIADYRALAWAFEAGLARIGRGTSPASAPHRPSVRADRADNGSVDATCDASGAGSDPLSMADNEHWR